MKCSQIINMLESFCPQAAAESWDNPGLLAGDDQREIKKIYIALDATSAVVDQAIKFGADLLITHHPLIFSGIKKINTEDIVGRRLLKLIENRICYYAMHTNFDSCVMGTLAGNMMGLENMTALGDTLQAMINGKEEIVGIGCVGQLKQPMSLKDCAILVKNVFDIPDVRYFGNGDALIEKVAVCPGAGKSLIDQAINSGAQVYITGDIGHHDGIDANEDNLLVIDAGHEGIEHIFISYMDNYFRQQIKEVEVMTEQSNPPFVTV